MSFLRVLKVSLASKVRQENQVQKEKQEHLDLRAWLENQVLRYMFRSQRVFASIQGKMLDSVVRWS